MMCETRQQLTRAHKWRCCVIRKKNMKILQKKYSIENVKLMKKKEITITCYLYLYMLNNMKLVLNDIYPKN
jgi:hypothetical protein